MGIVIQNALLVDIDPPGVQSGGLRIEGGRIAARGDRVSAAAGDELVDCDGAVVLPGLVNGHTHLYSALAVGMPPPPRAPGNFREILELVWWRLDRALDADSIEASACIGALEALHCGTTTLIDHHASPSCIDGSLDMIRGGIERVGLRGVLCYETTDRHGVQGRQTGLVENRRFLDACRAAGDNRFAGLVGAHASFTLEDETMDALRLLADEFGAGVHIHVAEDPCDEAECRAAHGTELIDRFARHGLVRRESVFAHGTHLNDREIGLINEAGVTVAHNPRSNMNNAVGYAPVARFRCPVMLGTDGIGSDLFAEARHAWFISRHMHAGLAPADIVRMLTNSARRASESLGVALGRLEVGAAADVVVTDLRPATPFTADNLAGHVIFGMSSRDVRHVMVDGEWRLREQAVVHLDERDLRERAREQSARLWARMAALD